MSIRFDNESECREYVSRWLDEQPVEDVHATVVDLVLHAFMVDCFETDEVTLDPDKALGSGFIEHTISNIRAMLEMDEMLNLAEHGHKAPAGSRWSGDKVWSRYCALHDTELDDGEHCEECGKEKP